MNSDKKTMNKNTDRALTNKSQNKDLPASFDMPMPLFIEHEIDGTIIAQRPRDGYINATSMCKRAGKFFANYNENATTQSFLQELSSDIGIPISELIQTVKSVSDPKSQGTWVHPQVAIHLAQWLSPQFAVQVTKWVFEWMSGNISGNMPYHLRRYVANMGKIPNGYFSMLNEIMYSLVAPLEHEGYVLPAKLMPDISTGQMFSDFLREQGLEPEKFPTYKHVFIDGNRPPVNARLYPNEFLGQFRDYMDTIWKPQKALGYFTKKDKKAIPYIKKVLLPAPKKEK